MGRKYYIGSSEDWSVENAKVIDWEWITKEAEVTAFKVTLSVPRSDGAGFAQRPVSIPKWKADESGLAAGLEAIKLADGEFGGKSRKVVSVFNLMHCHARLAAGVVPRRRRGGDWVFQVRGLQSHAR